MGKTVCSTRFIQDILVPDEKLHLLGTFHENVSKDHVLKSLI